MISLTAVQQETKQYLSKFKWQKFATLRCHHIRDLSAIEREIKLWVRQIIRGESLQIAYMGVLNDQPYKHCHLLLLGQNRHGKTLKNVDMKQYESIWKQSADIVPVTSISGVTDYIARQNMFQNTSNFLTPYAKTLLMKNQIKSRN